jgi:large subunit ribosomal protein L25
MPDFIKLAADERKLFGKKVRQLRDEGKTPAIVYGPGAEPLALTVDRRELRQVLLEAGGTQLIEIDVAGEKIPTLARAVQREPLQGTVMHVDFYRVSMDRVISADVPILLEGENPLVTTGAAVLVQGVNSLLIEALPAHLPPSIEIDISQLEEIGDQILVSELVLPEGTRTLTDGTDLVIKLDYPRMIEEEEEEEEEDLLFGEEAADVEVISEREEEEEFEEEE